MCFTKTSGVSKGTSTGLVCSLPEHDMILNQTRSTILVWQLEHSLAPWSFNWGPIHPETRSTWQLHVDRLLHPLAVPPYFFKLDLGCLNDHPHFILEPLCVIVALHPVANTLHRVQLRGSSHQMHSKLQLRNLSYIFQTGIHFTWLSFCISRWRDLHIGISGVAFAATRTGDWARIECAA